METNKNLTFPVKLLPFLNAEDNTVISPYGIKTVLSMSAEGASDKSLEQILKVFGFDSMEELRTSVLGVQDEGCPAFDKIATKPLYAHSLIQEAEIAVDEKGTVAIAVTEEDSHIGDFIDEFETIVFNKPFYYFLRNTTTGEIVFMGKVNKLEDCERQVEL